MSDTKFWKQKLLAYLHDPPSKCLDLGAHTGNAQTLMRQAGFGEEEVNTYNRPADHTASAADRFPFPGFRASGLSCAFDGVRACFHHPLSGGLLPIGKEFASAEFAFETDQTIQPVAEIGALPVQEQWRARFFAHWRLYQRNAGGRDHRFAFLPADTRLPDHTVWTHMQVVSALAGCAYGNEKDSPLAPAFLKFQLGPVQDFIAQARSIRDLWSGSYLLSWLVAAGLKALAAEVGPDAVVFPNLVGQPLFDFHWRDDLWNKISVGGKTCWESIQWDNAELLTPNLPNAFLAVVPMRRASELGELVKKAMEDEWRRIADAVWKECEAAGLTAEEIDGPTANRKSRYDAQVARFLSVSWQSTNWPKTMDDALALAEQFDEALPIRQAANRVLTIKECAERGMPVEHRDGRYYLGGGNGPKQKLSNLGLGWSIMLALNSWQLDAVRQNRAFSAWATGGWNEKVGIFSNKDSLNGREEAVAGGREWQRRAAEMKDGPWKNLFKKDDWLGASALIKRLWHFAYLKRIRGLETDSRNFPMPNTRGIAAHAPFQDEGEEDVEKVPNSEKYLAVLAFDGDEIGKWVSGENTPMFSKLLADYKDGSGTAGFGSKPYFECHAKEFLHARRPLSPSYHLQFSEALANFAMKCAGPIVEAYDGRLIYAGGDDLLALVPADVAIACASSLVLAFQGSEALKAHLQADAVRLRNLRATGQTPPYFQKLAAEGRLLGTSAPGFLHREDFVDSQHNHPIPFLVPGPTACASVGLAIAHFKAPLQDGIREAQAAEKRAKQEGRSRLAVTLVKRSGEIHHWGCSWEGKGIECYESLLVLLGDGVLSAKFPHRVIALLEPYLADENQRLGATTSAQGFKDVANDIIAQEIRHVTQRQRGPQYEPSRVDDFLKALSAYLQPLDHSQKKLRATIGLCETAAFAHRTSPRSDENPQPKGTK